MTAMHAAFKRAGFDTAAAELRAKVTEALVNLGGDADAAALKLMKVFWKQKREDIFLVTMRHYVEQFKSDATVLAKLASAQKEHEQEDANGGGAPEVNVKRHKRGKLQRPKTEAEREAEREAALRVAGVQIEIMDSVYDRPFNGRAIGDVRWRELRQEMRDSAYDAANYIELGIEKAINTVLASKLLGHAQVSDHELTVRSVVGAKQLEAYVQEAKIEAPMVMDTYKFAYAHALERNTPREIAP